MMAQVEENKHLNRMLEAMQEKESINKSLTEKKKKI